MYKQKKVVLTGASGLIGREIILPLIECGYDVIILNRNNCDLFNENSIKNFFNFHKPQYLINFAWNTKDGYLDSELNLKYAQAGIHLLKYFGEFGGKRAIYAGTCFEYKFKNEPLLESDEINPISLYARTKVKLMEKGFEIAKNYGIEFGWGRIFYAFGKNEHKNRFTSNLIYSLKNNLYFEIRNSDLIRDYIYSKDIALAFLAFLNSNEVGIVNISQGNGASIKDFCLEFAKKLNKEKYLIFKNEEIKVAPIIVGNNTKLKKIIGFTPKYDIKSAVSEILY